MTPEEKAEKWLSTREVLVEYPYTVDTVRDALIRELKQAYLAGYAEAENEYLGVISDLYSDISSVCAENEDLKLKLKGKYL